VPHLREIDSQLSYRLIRPIAQGGMGEVFEAEQLGVSPFRKKVAIKLIRQEYASIQQFRDNFVGEARLVADLIHSNIVQTYHLGRIHGEYFMVMEYLDGLNLEEFMLQHRALGQEIPVPIAAFIVSRICRGLAHAHEMKDAEGNPLGIVHRDVSPRNVLLGHGGDVKLTDFGIAKAFNLMYNEEGKVIAGKDEYLSPEQARREVTDSRADLFSCGILLAEMILGYHPFLAKEGARTRENILNLACPSIAAHRDDIKPGLEEIVTRALEKDREQRYQLARELLTDLELYLYEDGYGPTHEKLAAYLKKLLAGGLHFESHPGNETESFGLNLPD